MAVSLSTDSRLEYNFYPSSGRQIQFRVKASNDAHVALTTGPNEGEPMWEVFIGGWKNTKSCIRKDRTKPDVVTEPTPFFLSPDEFRGFWIRWNENTLTVGKENEPEPFMSFTDEEPLDVVTFFGLCTGWGASGEWLVEAICITDSVGDVPPVVGLPTPSAPSECPEGSLIWLDATAGEIPPGAVAGGEDNGEPLYVGRANHEGELIPGKIKPGHGVCYIPYAGGEHGKEEYQVLCAGSNISWVPTSNDEIPANAVPAGESSSGEPLFVGRVNHEGTVTLGKVHPSHRVLYIPFAGEEVAFGDYEILVNN